MVLLVLLVVLISVDGYDRWIASAKYKDDLAQIVDSDTLTKLYEKAPWGTPLKHAIKARMVALGNQACSVAKNAAELYEVSRAWNSWWLDGDCQSRIADSKQQAAEAMLREAVKK